MPEMHLRQPGFTYSSCGPRTKKKTRIQKLKKKNPNTSGLIKKTNQNTKITEIKNKVSSVTELVTTAVFNKKRQRN